MRSVATAARRLLTAASLVIVLIMTGRLPAIAQATTTFTTDSSIASGNSTYDGQNIVVRGCTVTIDGPHSFNSLTVEQNASSVSGTVTHSSGPANALQLTIATNVTVKATCRIDVSGLGYSAASGPGAGAAGNTAADLRAGGAGHGGMGGLGYQNPGSGGAAYDSLTGPTLPGSGGGSYGAVVGGSGGGVARLIISGTLTVESGGLVRSEGFAGTPNRAGGGSGGSVWITCGTLAGAGAIIASGGFGYDYGGGGAGGRIAVYYSTSTWTGVIFAASGSSQNQYGGAGTVYLKQASAPTGQLIVDGGINTNPFIAETPVSAADPIGDITVVRRGLVRIDGTASVGNVTVDQWAVLAGSPLSLTINGNLTVTGNAAIDVSFRGSAAGGGPGAGASGDSTLDHRAGGAGHGGVGGDGYQNTGSGGPAYDSLASPTQTGSGGGNYGISIGGAGGGAIRLVVNGTLSVDSGCRISADAQSSSNRAGGGSGGSIWITCGTLAGSGSLSAVGGTGLDYGGGGAGGRIALYYDAKPFNGLVSVAGGSSQNQFGADGTIYQETSSGLIQPTLSISPKTLSGGLSTVASVTLSSAAPAGGATIYLTSASSRVNLPSSFTIPAGQTSGSVTFTTNPVASNTTVTVQARLWGFTSNDTVTLTPWLANLTISPAALNGGASATGIITLADPAPTGGLSVALSSSNPSVSVPASVLVPAGSLTVPFTATTAAVASPITAVITGSVGPQTKTATLLVNPGALSIKSISFSPTAVTGGGKNAVSIVTLTGKAPTGGILVALSSDNPAVASGPASVLIPAGRASASFIVTTKLVTTTTGVTFSATLGITKTAKLTVRPTGVASLVLSPTAVTGGTESIAIVTLDSTPAFTVSITITSDKAVAIPETPLLIPPGQTITTGYVDTTTVAVQTIASIKAKAYAADTGKTAKLTVNP